MSKVVFIMGAGFSAPAGMPVQADIMLDVLKAKSKSFQDTVRDTYSTLFNMGNPDDMRDVPLEDVFTVLDRAHRNGEVLRGLTHEEIRKSLIALVDAITHEFNKKLRNSDLSRYEPFFKELISARVGDGSPNALEKDEYSIISLNWDTIPDYLLTKLGGPNVGIDYACYDYEIEKGTSHIPSIVKKAKGVFNIKLLKPHGSLNWAYCPSCNRLFTDGGDGIAPPVCFPHQHTCRYCEDVELENLIITPTLVKELSQTHLKMVWHNIQMDLQEAERIVFLGYSLPMADFEFRYTLLRAILTNDDVAIRAVLFPPDALIKSDKERWIRDQTEERYLNFFGQRDVDFKYMDVIDFVNDQNLLWSW